MNTKHNFQRGLLTVVIVCSWLLLGVFWLQPASAIENTDARITEDVSVTEDVDVAEYRTALMSERETVGEEIRPDTHVTQTGSIIGMVTDDNGAPLANVIVEVFAQKRSNLSAIRLFFTEESGVYTITHLPVGVYYLHFETSFISNSLSEYYPDQPILVNAAPITVTVETTTTINASLTTGGKIHGRVTAIDSSLPLSGVLVAASMTQQMSDLCGQPATFYAYRRAKTDEAGFYTINGLPSGNYAVRFVPAAPAASGYLATYYSDQPNAPEQKVTVVRGATTDNIDVALPKGGVITGRITAADTDLPLTRVVVSTNCSQCNAAVSDANGVYTLTNLLTAQYKLRFTPTGAAERYQVQWHPNTPNSTEAQPISMTVGGIISAVNASLAPGGQILGRVTAAESGLGVESIYVEIRAQAAPTSAALYSIAFTDSSGYFTSTGLITGQYTIYLSDYSRYYLPISNTVAVTLDPPVSAPMIMQRGGVITGVVQYADTLLGTDSIVELLDVNGRTIATTNAYAYGRYTLPGLPAGVYHLRFTATERIDRFADACNIPDVTTKFGEVYYNQASTLLSSQPVVVVLGENTPNINSLLYPVGQPLFKQVWLPLIHKH